MPFVFGLLSDIGCPGCDSLPVEGGFSGGAGAWSAALSSVVVTGSAGFCWGAADAVSVVSRAGGAGWAGLSVVPIRRVVWASVAGGGVMRRDSGLILSSNGRLIAATPISPIATAIRRTSRCLISFCSFSSSGSAVFSLSVIGARFLCRQSVAHDPAVLRSRVAFIL